MMIWKDKELKTLGEISDAIHSIYEVGDQDEADEFMRLMLAENEHARGNVGYLTGYFSPEDADGMRKLFKVTHPIFGNHHPTPAEAFEAGRNMGKALKK